MPVGHVQVGLDAIEPGLRVTLGINMNHGHGVGAQDLDSCFALLVGFGLVACFFEGLNQQGAIFRVVRLAVGSFAKGFGGGGKVCARLSEMTQREMGTAAKVAGIAPQPFATK